MYISGGEGLSDTDLYNHFAIKNIGNIVKLLAQDISCKRKS